MLSWNCCYSECLEVGGVLLCTRLINITEITSFPQIIIQGGVLVSPRKRFPVILFSIFVTDGLYFWNFFRISKITTVYTARLLQQLAFSLTLQWINNSMSTKHQLIQFWGNLIQSWNMHIKKSIFCLHYQINFWTVDDAPTMQIQHYQNWWVISLLTISTRTERFYILFSVEFPLCTAHEPLYYSHICFWNMHF